MLAVILSLFVNQFSMAYVIDNEYLLNVIENNKLYCKVQTDPVIQERCFLSLKNYLSAVESCEATPIRKQEVIRATQKNIAHTLEDVEIPVPPAVLKVFDHLTQTIGNLFPEVKNIKWKLSAYTAETKNASAGADGHIIISEQMWKSKNPLNDSELAAIFSHELGHVVKNHLLKLGCNALSWSLQDIPLDEAMEGKPDDKSRIPGYPRGDDWQKISFEIEYEADLVAGIILKLNGYDPLLMAQALIKIKESGSEVASHPSLDLRIRAIEHANQN
jgi:hypothetical protein